MYMRIYLFTRRKRQTSKAGVTRQRRTSVDCRRQPKPTKLTKTSNATFSANYKMMSSRKGDQSERAQTTVIYKRRLKANLNPTRSINELKAQSKPNLRRTVVFIERLHSSLIHSNVAHPLQMPILHCT